MSIKKKIILKKPQGSKLTVITEISTVRAYSEATDIITHLVTNSQF